MKPERVLEVEVWSDFVCPWCFIGKRNLDAALNSFAAKHPQAASALHDLSSSIASAVVTEKQPAVRKLIDARLAKLS